MTKDEFYRGKVVASVEWWLHDCDLPALTWARLQFNQGDIPVGYSNSYNYHITGKIKVACDIAMTAANITSRVTIGGSNGLLEHSFEKTYSWGSIYHSHNIDIVFPFEKDGWINAQVVCGSAVGDITHIAKLNIRPRSFNPLLGFGNPFIHYLAAGGPAVASLQWG